MKPFQFLLCFGALCSSLEKGQPYIFRVGSGQVLISACSVWCPCSEIYYKLELVIQE
jgi:hypothetical protein